MEVYLFKTYDINYKYLTWVGVAWVNTWANFSCVYPQF